MEKNSIFISIIIPIAPGNNNLSVVDSLRKADLKNKAELLVVIGTQPSLQRNIAAKKAKGELLCFLDNDSEVERKYFNKIVKHLSDNKDIVGVGGPWTTKETDNFFQKCFGLVFSSFFVSIDTRRRFTKVGEKPVITAGDNFVLCNFCIKKDIYLKEGGLNENLYPNEENEFLKRLTKKRYKFLYDPNLVIFRSQRKDFFSFLRQIFRYGRGRADHFFENTSFKDLFFLIPSFFSLYMVSLIFYHQLWYLWPLFTYFVLSIFFSFYTQIENKGKIWLSFLVLPILFFFTHITYGLGFIFGAIKKIAVPLKEKSIKNQTAVIKKITLD